MKNRLVVLYLLSCSLLGSFVCPVNAEPISVSAVFSSVYKEASSLEEQRQKIEEAIEELDRHFCFPKANLPLNVHPGVLPENFGGVYSEKDATAYINLLGQGDEAPMLVAVHEIYHHLSLRAFSEKQKKSLEAVVLPELIKTQRVRDIRIFSLLFSDDASVRVTAEYLLSSEELMARAFVQYFVGYTRNYTATKEFNDNFKGRWGWGHWEEKDFQKTYEVLDKKLREFGWHQ